MVIFEAIFVIYTVIRLKSTDDLLQGVNKLDYFIKASVFQIYKNQGREQLKHQSFNSSINSPDFNKGDKLFVKNVIKSFGEPEGSINFDEETQIITTL